MRTALCVLAALAVAGQAVAAGYGTAASVVTAVLSAGSALIGKVGIDQTTPGTTNAVSATNLPTTVDTNSGNKSASTVRTVEATDAPAVATKGQGATGASAPAGATMSGVRAQSSEATAVTNGQLAAPAADLVGKAIVLPYANPENFVNGVTAAITDTTSTSVIASAGGSLRNYITQCTVTNSHATVGTFVKILDGSTIIWEPYAAAVGGGVNSAFPVPLRGTAATAINCQPVTTGANVICSCSGYKGV